MPGKLEGRELGETSRMKRVIPSCSGNRSRIKNTVKDDRNRMICKLPTPNPKPAIRAIHAYTKPKRTPVFNPCAHTTPTTSKSTKVTHEIQSRTELSAVLISRYRTNTRLRKLSNPSLL